MRFRESGSLPMQSAVHCTLSPGRLFLLTAQSFPAMFAGVTPPATRILCCTVIMGLVIGNVLPCTSCGRLAHLAGDENLRVPLSIDKGHALSRTTYGSGNLTVEVRAEPALLQNSAVMAAFERGVAQWRDRLASPVTLTIDADFQPLGESTIGQTSSVFLFGGYDLIRDQMVAAAVANGGPDAALLLPTSSEFSAILPDGFVLDGQIAATKANLKAMGFVGLDDLFGATDGSITFSSEFGFDFDNRDGVDALLIDFESVVAHEIGHMLGFVSILDTINASFDPDFVEPLEIPLTPLDLFRFTDTNGDFFPASIAEFVGTPRNFVPGVAASFYASPSAFWELSTGLVNPSFPGTDGRQASHWRDQTLGGEFIGMMNPTIAAGELWNLTDADLGALAALGWQVVPTPVPEPFSGAVILLLLTLAVWRRRQFLNF